MSLHVGVGIHTLGEMEKLFKKYPSFYKVMKNPRRITKELRHLFISKQWQTISPVFSDLTIFPPSSDNPVVRLLLSILVEEEPYEVEVIIHTDYPFATSKVLVEPNRGTLWHPNIRIDGTPIWESSWLCGAMTLRTMLLTIQGFIACPNWHVNCSGAIFGMNSLSFIQRRRYEETFPILQDFFSDDDNIARLISTWEASLKEYIPDGAPRRRKCKGKIYWDFPKSQYVELYDS